MSRTFKRNTRYDAGNRRTNDRHKPWDETCNCSRCISQGHEVTAVSQAREDYCGEQESNTKRRNQRHEPRDKYCDCADCTAGF